MLRTEETSAPLFPLTFADPAISDDSGPVAQLMSVNMDSAATNHYEIPSRITAALAGPHRKRRRARRPKSRRALNEVEQRRTAFRVEVTLAAMAEWSSDSRTSLKKPAVVQNLSGQGANILVDELPEDEQITLSLIPPEGFVAERLQQGFTKDDMSVTSRWVPSETHLWKRDQVRYQVGPIEARVVRANLPDLSAVDSTYKRLSLEFLEPHEGCFRLVRYVERRPVHGSAHTLHA